jgi:hypothetical protein
MYKAILLTDHACRGMMLAELESLRAACEAWHESEPAPTQLRENARGARLLIDYHNMTLAEIET